MFGVSCSYVSSSKRQRFPAAGHSSGCNPATRPSVQVATQLNSAVEHQNESRNKIASLRERFPHEDYLRAHTESSLGEEILTMGRIEDYAKLEEL